MQNEQLAYWAGFFDYEAGICFCKTRYVRKGRDRIAYICRIEGRSHIKSVVDALKDAWGGTICKRRNRFIWWICGNRAGYMVKKILPFIQVKKESAQMVLDFCSTIFPPDGNQLPQDIVDIRESLVKRGHEMHEYYRRIKHG